MNIIFCSGFGRYHTDNPDNPKARPFSTITYDEIVEKASMPPTVLKQSAQWFIPSVLLSRSKSTQIKHGKFYSLVLDLDHNPPTINKIAEIVTLACRGCNFLIYTSRSATESCQKSHVLIPTIKLTGYRWKLAQSVLNDQLEKAGITPDRKTEDPNQIIYLPNRGQYYDFIHKKGTVFNPLKAWYPELLKKHQNIEAKKQARLKKAACRPARLINREHSIIDEFNATYTVEELLIQAGYAQKKTSFRHPNSETGNYSASVKNNKVFTLSSSDPLYSTHAHDPFNVFTILFNDCDRKAAMLNAGDNWLSIDGISWNKHQQQSYMERTNGN
jgi:hypothetical protein